MTLVTQIATGIGNLTSDPTTTQRTTDDNGMWQVEWTPSVIPGTVTFELQVKLGNTLTGWATVKTITQAELGTSAGLKTYAEQCPLAVQMRVMASNNNSANAWKVVLQE